MRWLHALYIGPSERKYIKVGNQRKEDDGLNLLLTIITCIDRKGGMYGGWGGAVVVHVMTRNSIHILVTKYLSVSTYKLDVNIFLRLSNSAT